MNVNHSKPGFQIPAGACDCHMHIFGTADRYPFAPGRSYTPPEASFTSTSSSSAPVSLRRVMIPARSKATSKLASSAYQLTYQAYQSLPERVRADAASASECECPPCNDPRRAAVGFR